MYIKNFYYSNIQVLPPVRNRENQLYQKKTRKKKKPEVVEKPPTKEANQNGNSEEKKKRIRAYDYRSWDKFDVVSNKHGGFYFIFYDLRTTKISYKLSKTGNKLRRPILKYKQLKLASYWQFGCLRITFSVCPNAQVRS